MLRGLHQAVFILFLRAVDCGIAVSPNVVQESMAAYAPYFRGFEAVPAARAALAYSRSVEGAQTGQIYKVF